MSNAFEKSGVWQFCQDGEWRVGMNCNNHRENTEKAGFETRDLYAPQGESDKIVQVSGFGVANTPNTQCDYMLVGLTQSGRVVMSTGDGQWADVSPKD